MPNINIKVAAKIATNMSPDVVIVCGNSDYTVTFDFDTEWDAEPSRIARFVYIRNGLRLFQERQVVNNVAAVPKLAGVDFVEIGVYGGDLRTTTPARALCDRSILCGDPVEVLTEEERQSLIAQLAAHVYVTAVSTNAEKHLIFSLSNGSQYDAGEVPLGPKGDPGSAPIIGDNGNWWADGKDLGVAAVGFMTNTDKAALQYAHVTLTADGWTGAGPYTQSAEVPGMTAAWVPGIPSIVPGDTVEADLAAREALGCVTKITSKAGGLDFVCYEDKPTADITIRIPGLLE